MTISLLVDTYYMSMEFNGNCPCYVKKSEKKLGDEQC